MGKSLGIGIEISLTYAKDMLPYYESLSDLEGFVLLESLDRRYGRYDILCALPRDCVVNGIVPYADASASSKVRKDLPFVGGVISAITYDYGKKLRGVDSKLSSNWEIFSYVYDWAIIVDHQQKQARLFLDEQHPNHAAIQKTILHRWKKVSFKENSLAVEIVTPFIPPEQYYENFKKIQKALFDGRVYQINYTTEMLLHVQEGTDWDIYKTIRRLNPVPYAAFMRLDKATIISFSPERYMTIRSDGDIRTSPIKGSAPRAQCPEKDSALAWALKHCEKNRAENVMIVDLMRNDLSMVSQAGTVRVDALHVIESFPEVHHLVSHIHGQLQKGVSPIEAFFSCYPAGSITGAPKIEAMKVIDSLEQRNRGIYCGSIAYFSRNARVDSSVAIRTLHYEDNRLSVPSGGGIVIDSDCEEEYRECYTKVKRILTALGIHANT